MRGLSRTAGFTIIELMITILVFSILTAAAVPTMRVWIVNARVRAVADALQNGIRLAQAESLRRGRQIVFSLTNSTAPQNSLTAAANGNYWSINYVPAVTGATGDNGSTFIESGVLNSSTESGIAIAGQAAICFNSVGRLVLNAATGVAGGNCNSLPAGNPPVWAYNITPTAALSGARPLRVTVALGGQVHLCDPAKVLSATNPDGC